MKTANVCTIRKCLTKVDKKICNSDPFIGAVCQDDPCTL